MTHLQGRLFEKVADVVALDFERSTACFYQRKRSRFLHWWCGRNVSMQGLFSADNEVVDVSVEGAEALNSCR